MKTRTKTAGDAATTVDLREQLKALVKQELDRLPDTLDGLEPKDRLSIVAKLIPLVMPKTKPVRCDFGEPHDWTL